MKLTKKDIVLSINTGNDVIVSGYYFEYECLEFNVHKDHTGNGSWKVTDYITGMSVVTGCSTRKAALESFKRVFDRLGREKVIEAIERNQVRKMKLIEDRKAQLNKVS